MVAAIFTLYLLEAIVTFADPKWVDKLGTTLRRGPSVISEAKRARDAGKQAYPFLQPDTFADSAGSGRTIPLSGPASSLVVLCNEMGSTISYQSDSLGFRNPRDIWDPIHPDVAIVGDSFAHGFCRPDSETVSGILRSMGARVVNLGLTGAGPLAELGVIREYLRPVRAKRVYWLFYEGNDLIDLTSERKTVLANYLDSSFSQELIERRDEVDALMKRWADSAIAAFQTPGFAIKATDFILLRKLRTATGLYRQPSLPRSANENAELVLLDSVLARATSDIRSWGGELTLVYLPERRRFNKWTPPVVGENHDPLEVERRVKEIAVRRRIRVIDIAAAFAAETKPRALWNARRYHYNARGYRVVADSIMADLRSR